MNELARQCLYLPTEERTKLINILQESIKDEESGDGRFDIIVKSATDVVGHGVLTKSRALNCIIGRRMIAHQMREDGCSILRIAKMMKLHHASVIHMEKMMNDVIANPHIFKLEYSYWTEFKKKIKSYDIHERTAQGS